MPPTDRWIKIFGACAMVGAILLNPYTLAFILSADHKIESAGVIAAIVCCELLLFSLGLFAFFAPAKLTAFVKHRWKEAILLAGAYLFCEVVVMAAGIFLPRPTPERIRFFRDFTAPHETLGYTMAPNLKDFELTWLDEGVSGVYDSDSQGFRNYSVDVASTSIFFIGDSFTHGSWVTQEESYAGRVGVLLGIPVANFGMGGYGVTQYTIVARDFIPKNDIPKTVVVGFFANDLEAPPPEEAMKTLYEKEMLSQIAVPSFRDRFAFKYSVAGQLTKRLFRPREQAVMSNGMSLFTNRGASISFALRDHEPFQASLKTLIATLRGREDVKDILFVLIPSKESVYREAYASFFGDASYLENERLGYEQIGDAAREAGIPVLDLTPIFRDHKGEKLYFDIDAHWNPAGHALAAEKIIEYVQQ